MPRTALQDPPHIRHTRVRHLAAITVMLALSVTTLTVGMWVLSGASGHPEVVNTAGRQRAWSQRIALQASLLGRADMDQERVAAELRLALESMSASNDALSKTASSGPLFDTYHGPSEQLRARVERFVARADALLPREAGQPVDPQAQDAIALEASDLLPHLDRAVALHEATAEANIRSAQQGLVALFVLSALAISLLWRMVFRPVTRQLRKEHSLMVQAEAERLGEQDAHAFNRRLNAAFEMVTNEDELLGVVNRAMDELGPPLPLEMLLTDKSHANFNRRAVHPTAPLMPCAVEQPWQCIALRRGRTSHFPSGAALDACPRLEGSACGALCVPITFMGETLGVMHTSLPENGAVNSAYQRRVEELAAAGAARMSAIRSFEQVQLQATTDPLTGLLNRRSLEQEVRKLVLQGAPFAVAIADLDHFKHLNDAHGHEAGDRALQTFSKACRDVLRERDLVSRFGGEEFVMVFAELDAAGAGRVLERLRIHLAKVVAGNDTPTFTASFGVSDTRVGLDLSMLIQVADAALLRAKDQGRDRILVADMGNPDACAEPDEDDLVSESVRVLPRAAVSG